MNRRHFADMRVYSNKLHGAESSLRSSSPPPLCLAHKNPPLVRILSQINLVYILPHYLLEIPYNIHPSTPEPCRKSLFFTFYDQHFIRFFLFLCHPCYMSRPSYPWYDHRNNIPRRVQLMVLLKIFSPSSLTPSFSVSSIPLRTTFNCLQFVQKKFITPLNIPASNMVSRRVLRRATDVISCALFYEIQYVSSWVWTVGLYHLISVVDVPLLWPQISCR